MIYRYMQQLECTVGHVQVMPGRGVDPFGTDGEATIAYR
jgi:hypothetical protein